jgi:hypothetical protein
MWDKQMICWYEANLENGNDADDGNVGRNTYVKKTYGDEYAVGCSWILLDLGGDVGLSSLRLFNFCSLCTV